MDVEVRAVTASDRDDWAALFAAYREFYDLAPDARIVDRVWSWIMDGDHEVNALIATSGGRAVGIAHYRRFARPSMGTTGIYLDDLFTHSDNRGGGIGRALIRELSELAARNGDSVVRWMTSESNATARLLYHRVATQTQWITYELPAGSL